jgi:hypothetical protein
MILHTNSIRISQIKAKFLYMKKHKATGKRLRGIALLINTQEIQYYDMHSRCWAMTTKKAAIRLAVPRKEFCNHSVAISRGFNFQYSVTDNPPK